MKRIIILALLTVAVNVVNAKCGANGIYLLSGDLAINKNGRIILEFYNKSRELIPGLNKKYPVYLESGKEKIPLIAAEICKGEFNITQVVFKVSGDLVAKQYYNVKIGNLPSGEMQPSVLKAGAKSNSGLLVNDRMDNAAPELISIPVVKETTVEEYGCGPARYIHIQLAAKDESELLVRASVRNKKTGKLTDYILPLTDGVVKIGHDMCAGPFHFDDGDSFEVSFRLMDQSGNIGAATNAISFIKPTNAYSRSGN